MASAVCVYMCVCRVCAVCAVCRVLSAVWVRGTGPGRRGGACVLPASRARIGCKKSPGVLPSPRDVVQLLYVRLLGWGGDPPLPRCTD
jgi:hypothetical protein